MRAASPPCSRPAPTPAKSSTPNGCRPGVTRAVVQERLRAEIPEVPKGLAYDVYVDVLDEFGRNARVGTWLIRMFRESSAATEWRIARLNILTTVRGLYRLSINTEKQYRIVNLAVSAEDFDLRIPNGAGVRRGNGCRALPASSYSAAAR